MDFQVPSSSHLIQKSKYILNPKYIILVKVLIINNKNQLQFLKWKWNWLGIWRLVGTNKLKKQNGPDTRHSNRLLRTCHLPTGNLVPQDWHLHHWMPTILVLGSIVTGHALRPSRLSSLYSHQEAFLTGWAVLPPSRYTVQVAALDWLCIGLVLGAPSGWEG